MENPGFSVGFQKSIPTWVRGGHLARKDSCHKKGSGTVDQRTTLRYFLDGFASVFWKQITGSEAQRGEPRV
jgi:hypothetical protein